MIFNIYNRFTGRRSRKRLILKNIPALFALFFYYKFTESYKKQPHLSVIITHLKFTSFSLLYHLKPNAKLQVNS